MDKDLKFKTYISILKEKYNIPTFPNDVLCLCCECDLKNMLCYVDGFVNSGAYTKKLDNELVIQNVKDFLIENKIIVNNKNKSRKMK